MSERKIKIYPKAPIIEAIIDIVVILPDSINFSHLKKIKAKIKNEYPIEETIYQQTAAIKFDKLSSQVSSLRTEVGLKFSDINKKKTVQIKLTGFTYSISGPYTNWEVFRDEANKLWQIYNKAFKPIRTTRVAVRYINRIDIPATKFPIDEYFNIYPKMPEVSHEKLLNFFTQLQIELTEGGIAIINQGVAPPSGPGITSILLDFDIFDMSSFNPKGSELWQRIELLRHQKNYLFESCLTEKSKELIS